MSHNLLRKVSTAFVQALTSTNPSSDSSNILSQDSDAPSGIPPNILAFRTITRLLEIIQQERPFKIVEDEPELSNSDRRELRLLSAFSTVAVADRDVVAVVAKQHPGNLEVIACNYDDSRNQQPIEPPQAPSILPPGFLSWLFTKNFRRDDLTKMEVEDKKMAEEERKRKYPVIKTIGVSPLLVGRSDEGLRKYLEQRW